MDTQQLQSKFDKIGGRAKVEMTGRATALNVLTDRRGEFFSLAVAPDDDLEILDLQPQDRHLLLLVRHDRDKSKFLCGHDERHWFVASIPEIAPVGTVSQAKEALKPTEVKVAQARVGLRQKAAHRRKNRAWLRQGEWFFLPVPDLVVDERLILRREPIRRGRGKPHLAEMCYRHGGETVYVCGQYPNGVDGQEYARIIKHDPEAKRWGWRVMVRDAAVFVKGRISHPDHKTVTLKSWCRILQNTETQAAAIRHVAFLD